MDFIALAQECAPDIHPRTLAAIVRTESSFNQYAIGVVGGRLERQPQNLAEAVATAEMLLATGWNASFGLGQVNKTNLAQQGLNLRTVFDPCANLRAAAAIFNDNYRRARARARDDQHALHLALSEYYSGNYSTGFTHGYVQKVVDNVGRPIPVHSPSVAPAPSAQIPALAAKGQGTAAVSPPPVNKEVRARVFPTNRPAFVFDESSSTDRPGSSESAFVFSPRSPTQVNRDE